MDPTRLRVLVALAREGSVTAAADALHYAQPSVSHHLARLEAEVGVPLTTRVGRGLVLTDAGRLLAERAQEILGRIESVRSEIAQHAGLAAGRLRLAAFPSALAVLVPHLVAAYRDAHPGVAIALTEAEPPVALRLLRSGEVDVALTFRHDDAPAGTATDVRSRTLLREPVYAVTPRRRRWKGPRDELATYADQPWIAGCERCREHLLASCERAGFTPRVDFETDDYLAVQSLVAAGLGVSTLPGLAVLAHRNPAVRLDRLADDGRDVEVSTYGGAKVPVTTGALLELMPDVVEALPAWPRS